MEDKLVKVNIENLLKREDKLIDIINKLLLTLHKVSLAQNMDVVKNTIGRSLKDISVEIEEMMKIKVTSDED